jgi:SSS family solute:Na+ symporter/sodium/proline symporter
MYQRFFSAKSATVARRAVLGWIIGTIAIESLIAVIAIVGSSIFPGIDGETVILQSVKEALPAAIGCLTVAAIAAVIVSTADSFLLVPSTNLMRDIYQRFINPEVSEKRFLLYSRIVVVLLGIVAYIQVQFFEKILEMAIYAYTMYGVGITPAVMAAFFWKRATPAGGVAAISAGMIVTVGWEVSDLATVTGFETVIPALLASLLCMIVVSLATPKPDASHWKPFFE